MRTHYTLMADGLTLSVSLTDDPTECWVDVTRVSDYGDAARIRLPMNSTTAARELRRAITAMLDHRASLAPSLEGGA